MNEKQTILVTGGAGYIGSHTVVELVEAGYAPVILDDFSNANKKLLKNLNALCGIEIPIEEGSCTDLSFLNQLFEKYSISAVIHFAAFKAVGESVSDPIKYYKNNLYSTVALVECMQKHGVKQLVFSSSCTVYGTPENGFKVSELTSKGTPQSPYGWTKHMCEQILTDCASNGNLQPVLLRYFNPIGAHQSGTIGELPVGVPNNIIPYMTQTAAGLRESLTVFGNDYETKDGTCIRDYIHVVDLAKAHVKALSIQQKNEAQVFNLGTGIGTSVLELISAFEGVTHKKMNWSFGPKRAGDIPEIFAEVEKAKQELNWTTQLTINDAIADAWRWETYRIQHEIN